MAKAKKKFKLSRTIDGITYVDSSTYQPHVRAARGTFTPICLAEGMKKSAAEQSQANLMAKIVFDAVKEFAPNFKDGKFWSRLVSAFRFLIKEKKDYALLKDMEVRPDYPMSKHGSFKMRNNLGIVELNYSLRTHYRLSVLRIATDQTMLISYPKEVIVITIEGDDLEGKAQLNFSELPNGAQVLYVIKCERLVNGKIEGLLSQKSVRFLKCS